MPRYHLFEVHEQAWCPPVIRDSATDCLRVVASVGQQFKYVLPKLHQAVQMTGSRCIVDLCSGGGGPWFNLAPQLHRLAGRPIDIVLTDLYPNPLAANPGRPYLTYAGQPVDATRVPASLSGFRTLFTAFHHFEPETARQILQDAVSRGQGIAIFEQTRRHPLALLVMLTIPLWAWLATPLIRPFRWQRLLWTYLIPVIPLVLCFDGLVSCLRTYSVAELQTMVEAVDAPGYVWDIGRLPSPLSPIGVTYLIGYPAAGQR